MASYAVISDRVVGFPQGSTVTDKQLEGCNVDALVAGGHIAPIPATTAKPLPPPDSDSQADPATDSKEQ